jgi:hypothetical protein
VVGSPFFLSLFIGKGDVFVGTICKGFPVAPAFASFIVAGFTIVYRF